MIEYRKDLGLLAIHTKNSSYVFTADSQLKSLYWGGRVRTEDCAGLEEPLFAGPMDPDLTREAVEYPIDDGQVPVIPCLQASVGGRRPGPFCWDGCQIGPEEQGVQQLEVRLKAPQDGLVLRLRYTVFAENDCLLRKAVLENGGGQAVRLRRFQTAAVHPPKKENYRLRYLSGTWMAENQITDMAVPVGTFVLESRTGAVEHRFNPAFALSRKADEEHGEVWCGLLSCIGSWKIEITRTIFGTVSVCAGCSDGEGETVLPGGASLETPELLLGYCRNGFGEMSRMLHQVQRDHFSVGQALRPVLYNSWEATAFSVTAANQMELAQRAAALGAELFVVDDGWFGTRSDDCSGLGDWTVNEEKFPGGLHALIRKVHSLGMAFGLWVEPESVNPDSELYRRHPDWICRQAGREPRLIRNQYLLDLSRPEVQTYLLETLDRLLEEYPIAFLKWDANRYLTDLDGSGQGAAHEQVLFRIWDELRRRHPGVEIECCASGGGRSSLAMLRRSEQCWTSDQTDPFERLFIQEGFTQFYRPGQMMCWVTDMARRLGRTGRDRTDFLFHSAMCGCLGIGADIRNLTEEEADLWRQYIALYKEIRETVQCGRLYRLRSPRTENLSAVEYVAQDGHEAVVLAFLHAQHLEGIVRSDGGASPEDRRLRLQGLEEEALYIGEDGTELSGAALMHLGVPVRLRDDYDSCLIRLRRL